LLGPLRSLLISIAAGALFVGGAYVAFRSGWIVPVVAPLGALAASATAVLVVLVVHEAVERRRVRELFSRFVPERVVDEVIDHTDDELRLGGVRRECTVLFSDLRGFTTYSEETPPDRVISVLNAYLTEMSDAIMDGGGTLVSYLGDGIMAVFGAPLDQPDHRDRAVAVAREMLSRLERVNREQGGGHDFRMGIGINTGYAMCGNVGSERRVEYTAIGDSINTAARLEGMTKGSGYDVFLAESTYCGMDSPASDLELVGELEVRGRRSTVRVWGLAVAASRAGGEVMYQARLTPVPFFTALSEDDLEVIARHADQVHVAAGEVLAREGDVGHDFFVIEEGTADVTRNGDVLDNLGPGDFFGEMALVEEDRRTATVTATSAMTLIVLTSSSFRAIHGSMPQLHALVAGAIRRRRTPVT
jgi:class 3 adenylate cyclase